MVLVPKPDKRIQMCGDYKVSINPWVKTDVYPLPTIQDLFATLAGGKVFTKIDLKQVYQQLEVDEKSQNSLRSMPTKAFTDTWDCLLGCPATMDQILQGAKSTICYLDNILVSGANEAEHIQNLEVVLQRLQSRGIKVRLDKCRFMQQSVDYLGHRIDATGLHPT